MEVSDADGRSYLPPLRKTKAIMAALALSGAQPVSREQLVGLLWSRRDRDHAYASLRQCVYQLRDVLQPVGDLLRSERNYLTLDTAQILVDTATLQQATKARPEPLDVMRGPLLQDLAGLDPAFDKWIAVEQRRLSAFARSTAEYALADETEPARMIQAAERLLRTDPTHEAGWRALMLAHAKLGNHVLAAQSYERCAITLAKAAGLSPSDETSALMAQIRQGTVEPPKLLVANDPTTETAARIGLVRIGITPVRALNRASEEFADGLAEEITTALTRFRSLSCIVPTVSGTSPDTAVPPLPDLDFLVEGSVQHSNEKTRVTVRLRDVRHAGEVVWSQRFQSQSTDPLDLQDDIAAKTVAQINSELMLRESARLQARPPANPSAAQLLLRGMRAIFRLQKASFLEAGGLLEAAVALDPEHAAAHAWWAYWHVLLMGQGWAADHQVATARTWDLTKRAIALDPYDAHALTLAGHVRAFAHRALDDAMALHDRALSINPNLPLAWLFSGLAHTYAGQHEEAIRRIRRARDLSPLDPHRFFFDMALTLSHSLNGEPEQAVFAGRAAAAANPGFSASFKASLAALGQLENADERTRVLSQLLALEPGFTVTDALARSPLGRAEDRDRFADGLLRAGLRR